MKPRTALAPSILVFFILNLCTGLNLGFTKCLKKSIRPVVYLFQFIMTVLIAVPLMMSNSDFRGFVFVSMGVEHVICVLLFQFMKYSVYDLVCHINALDKEIMRPVERQLGVILSAILTGTFTIKASICFWYCTYRAEDSCKYSGFPGYIMCILGLIVDCIPLIQVLIYYYIYRSVKYVKQMVQEPGIDIEVIVKKYVTVVDYYERIMPLYGVLLIVELVVNMPKLMMTMWHIIYTGKKENHGLKEYLSQSVFIFHIVLKFFTPAVIAEMTNAQVKGIKTLLQNRVVIQEDKKKKREASHLLCYMESCCFRYSVCRVVPLDLRLIVSMIGCCTTYFIVIAQFTHLI